MEEKMEEKMDDFFPPEVVGRVIDSEENLFSVIREWRGLSREELAKESGVDILLIAFFEGEEGVQLPQLVTERVIEGAYQALAKALGVGAKVLTK